VIHVPFHALFYFIKLTNATYANFFWCTRTFTVPLATSHKQLINYSPKGVKAKQSFVKNLFSFNVQQLRTWGLSLVWCLKYGQLSRSQHLEGPGAEQIQQAFFKFYYEYILQRIFSNPSCTSHQTLLTWTFPYQHQNPTAVPPSKYYHLNSTTIHPFQ
jgi:hypothetical protein